MKTLTWLVVFSSLAVSSSISSETFAQDNRDDYVSQASFIIGTYSPKPNDHTPQQMSSAAKTFLDSLDQKLRSRTVHALDSPEPRKWTNLPARPDAGGVPMGELNDDLSLLDFFVYGPSGRIVDGKPNCCVGVSLRQRNGSRCGRRRRGGWGCRRWGR